MRRIVVQLKLHGVICHGFCFTCRSKTEQSAHASARQLVLSCRCGLNATSASLWWCSSRLTTYRLETTLWDMEMNQKLSLGYASYLHCKCDYFFLQ